MQMTAWGRHGHSASGRHGPGTTAQPGQNGLLPSMSAREPPFPGPLPAVLAQRSPAQGPLPFGHVLRSQPVTAICWTVLSLGVGSLGSSSPFHPVPEASLRLCLPQPAFLFPRALAPGPGLGPGVDRAVHRDGLSQPHTSSCSQAEQPVVVTPAGCALAGAGRAASRHSGSPGSGRRSREGLQGMQKRGPQSGKRSLRSCWRWLGVGRAAGGGGVRGSGVEGRGAGEMFSGSGETGELVARVQETPLGSAPPQPGAQASACDHCPLLRPSEAAPGQELS